MKRSTYNIVFSNSLAPGKWGGGEKWIVTAGTGLARRGHRVTVAGRAGAILLARAKAAGLETVTFNISADFAPFKMFKVARFFREEKTDICILNLNKDVRVAGMAARRAGVPVVLARHGLELIRDRWKHRWTMGLVDGIITNSHTIRERYAAIPWMPGDKTEVIHNGLGIPEDPGTLDLRGTYGIPGEHLVIGAAGRLDRQKGFDLLIQSAAALRERPVSFLIAGKGKLQKQLQAMIAAHGMEDRVKLVGFLDNALSFLNSVDMVVLSSRYEGMPNTVLEAMALGKVVVATEVNGVQELIQDGVNGFSVPPESVAALTAGILRAKSCGEGGKIGQRAVETIRDRYSVARMVDHLEAYFRRKYASYESRIRE